MRAAHTPGPWHQRHSTSVTVLCDAERITGSGEVQAISYEIAYAKSAPVRDQRIANARLIAAAPEMFAALEKCRDKFAEYVGMHGFKLDGSLSEMERHKVWEKINRNQEMVDLCDAALAKARGDQ